MKLKLCFSILIFVVISYTVHGQLLSCSYAKSLTYGYICNLSITNPNGFNNFTQINGTHLAGMTNDDVQSIWEAYGSNHSSIIPSIICETFKNSVKISLNLIGLQSIDEDSFKNCKKLEDLNLEWNDITKIDENSFSNNLELKFFNLFGSQLTTLPENVFRNQRKLTSLDLSANSITDLPEKIFDSLENLNNLNLRRNQIKNLRVEWFKNLGNLKNLYLYLNGIEELPKDVFSSLQNLVSIFLNDNNLKVIHADSFGILTNFTTFYLQRNQIDAIDEKFIDNTGVKYLGFGNNTCASVEISDNLDSRESMRNQLQKCFENYKILMPETTTNRPSPPGCMGGNLDERVCRLEDRDDEMEENIEDLVKQNEVLVKENEEQSSKIEELEKNLDNQTKSFSAALEELENKILEWTTRPCSCR